MQLVHATAVAIAGRAVVLRGPPGSGKSDLALRLLDHPKTGLIADDQTELYLLRREVWAQCPTSIRGKLEIRGLGIVTVKPHRTCPVALVVDLAAHEHMDRMPELEALRTEVLGCVIPTLKLDAFQASAATRVRRALEHFYRHKS
jgi:HPr kinase/phosphorylase